MCYVPSGDIKSCACHTFEARSCQVLLNRLSSLVAWIIVLSRDINQALIPYPSNLRMYRADKACACEPVQRPEQLRDDVPQVSSRVQDEL